MSTPPADSIDLKQRWIVTLLFRGFRIVNNDEIGFCARKSYPTICGDKEATFSIFKSAPHRVDPSYDSEGRNILEAEHSPLSANPDRTIDECERLISESYAARLLRSADQNCHPSMSNITAPKKKPIHGEPKRSDVPADAVETPPVPCDLKVGDRVTFLNDYGLKFPGHVVSGFTKEVTTWGAFIYTTGGRGHAWWCPHKPCELKLEAPAEKTTAGQHPVFSSIGWLYGARDTIILTPICHGASWPTKVRISREEFEVIRHSKDLMMAKAMAVLHPPPNEAAMVRDDNDPTIAASSLKAHALISKTVPCEPVDEIIDHEESAPRQGI